MEAFSGWAESLNALPKSASGKAIRYVLEQRPYLEKVFLDGRLELSNNRFDTYVINLAMVKNKKGCL